MIWGKLGTIGGLFLAAFLIVFGGSMIIAVAIPTWVSGCLAIAAGLLILIGQ